MESPIKEYHMQEFERLLAFAAVAAECDLAFRSSVVAHCDFLVAPRRMSGSQANATREITDADMAALEDRLAAAGRAFAQALVEQIGCGADFGKYHIDGEGQLRSTGPRADVDNPHPVVFTQEHGYANPLAPDTADWMRLLADTPLLMEELEEH
jgi:hypothetical protein